MKEGLQFLKKIRVINNPSLVRRLNKCSDKYAGCEKCEHLAKCREIYDSLCPKATFMALMGIEQIKEDKDG